MKRKVKRTKLVDTTVLSYVPCVFGPPFSMRAGEERACPAIVHVAFVGTRLIIPSAVADSLEVVRLSLIDAEGAETHVAIGEPEPASRYTETVGKAPLTFLPLRDARRQGILLRLRATADVSDVTPTVLGLVATPVVTTATRLEWWLGRLRGRLRALGVKVVKVRGPA